MRMPAELAQDPRPITPRPVAALTDPELTNLDGLLSVLDDVLDLVAERLPRGKQQAQLLAIASAYAASHNGVPKGMLLALASQAFEDASAD
jgi:hypothetical protein